MANLFLGVAGREKAEVELTSERGWLAALGAGGEGRE
jgi:hypothetical protein